jgi:predicted transposase YbfD/YdcC
MIGSDTNHKDACRVRKDSAPENFAVIALLR